MKMNCEAVVLGVKERFGKDNKVYHDVNLDQDGDILTVSCTDDVFKALAGVKYKPCRLVLEYAKIEVKGQVWTRFGVVSAEVLK